MITKLFLTVCRVPFARRALWRGWYQYLARRFPAQHWSFMNYGFAELDDSAPALELRAGDEPDRYGIQLYERVVGPDSLEGLDVVEVGSGRGGGAAYVHRYRRPRTMTGVDFSKAAVAFANRHFRAEGLSFVHGDAEALPLPDASCDRVINVESSHCYPSRPRFFAEVRRVLRPDGRFHFSDIFLEEELEPVRSQLAEAGLELTEDAEITPNVVRALELANESKSAMIADNIPRMLEPTFRSFAGTEGSYPFELMKSGGIRYWVFEARPKAHERPAERPGQESNPEPLVRSEA